MSATAIVSIGTLVSGDIEDPLIGADSLIVNDGKITDIGTDVDISGIDRVIDAGGATVIPGLIDSHIHPVVGDFTPRQSSLGFLEGFVHGGVTSMISAGEPHTPGRPTDPAGVKALAILVAKSFQRLRPGGAKVLGGAVLLEPGLTEDDFAEMAAEGVQLVGEIGISGVKDRDLAAEMTAWARSQGMRVTVHTGGASIPGSGVIDADFVIAVTPNSAAHVNGGPTALPLADVARILDETDAHIEIVHNGNTKAAAAAVRLAAETGRLHRMVIGTDSPAGSGVSPLGILRTVSWATSLGGIDPEHALALATGNTARLHNLDRGVIEVGAAADLAIIDSPMGSQADDALAALAIGDTPSVYSSIIDGEVRFVRSRHTPPPSREIQIPWFQSGGGH